MPTSLRSRAADLVESVLSGGITPSAAVSDINAFPAEGRNDGFIQSAFHLLIHYREDEDIRRQDERYAEAQRRGLEDFVRKLRK